MNLLTLIFVTLSVVSPIRYTLRTIKGSVRPHRVTRLVVWVASLTSLIVTFGSDNTAGKLFGVVFFIRATFLLLLALKYGMGGRSKLDIFCLIIGVVGVLVSLMGNGLAGILLALAADVVGYVPAAVKTYKYPKSEEPVFYILEFFAALSIVIGIGETSVDIIMPLYFVVSCVVMLGLIYRPLNNVR
jgi:hypothetical protein